MNETKKLYRLDHGALAGVCGGVAEYFKCGRQPGAPHLGGAVLRGHRRAVALCGGGPAAAQEEPGLPRLVRTTEKSGTAAARGAAAVLLLSVFGGGIDMNFYERVYELVRRIPAGKCASYGQLALMLGNPRASRAVGYAMRACRTPGVPCHRVVRADGSTTPAFGPGVQRAMLEAEGVPFTADGRVELGGCRWDGA